MCSHVGSKGKLKFRRVVYKGYKGYDSPKPGFYRGEAQIVMARVREAGFISMIWKRGWFKDGKGFTPAIDSLLLWI